MDIEKMVEEFRQRLDYLRSKPSRVKSKEQFAQIKLDYFEELRDARKEGKPIVWVVWSVPSELIVAMDLAVFVPEQYSIQMSTVSTDLTLNYIQLAQIHGMAEEICRPHQSTTGMAIAGEITPPDCLISSTVPCDSYLMLFEVCSNIYKRPAYYLHIPMDTGEKLRDEAIVGYYQKQLEGLIEFLEKHTNRKMDYRRLKETAELSRRTHNYHVRIQQELRKVVPAALTGREGISFFGILYHCRGRQDALEYYETLYQERKEKADRKEAPLAEEKYRIGWIGALPYWNLTLLDWIKKEHNTEVVLDLNNFLPEPMIEEDTEPLRIIAKRVLGYPGLRVCWPYNTWREEFLNSCKEFKLDAFIIYNHFGCSNIGGVCGLMRDDLRKQIGIPTLIMDGDPIDPRVVSIEEQKSKIEDFLVTLKK
ncbi:MAG: 2-hydroxyacyl-CoA dehydratase family protein [Thermodesulfobacteriota bacterium]